MSGKFINKSYVNTIDSLTKGTILKVKNANYIYNDKPPVICKAWWNLNNKSTTLDEGTGAEYTALGKNSPFRYNKIIEAVFYSSGIKMEFDLQYEDDGLESSQPNISGIVLPNTWIPYANDYFIIEQAGKDWVYRVNSVTFDTIDNGNNVYRFEAMVDKSDTTWLDKQTVEKYRMIINNVGTNFNSIIKEESYNCIDTLDQILIRLKNNYIALFYNDSVQTFTYNGKYGNLYDPYMIEFLIRNNILSGSDEYIYIHHEIPVSRTFSIEYVNTFYRALETRSKDLFDNITFNGKLIDDQYSLFSTVLENYFIINKADDGLQLFQILDSLLVSYVKENKHVEECTSKEYYNIIIDFLNNKDINSSIVDILERMKFKPTQEMFYTLPMIIYIIEYGIKNLLK